MILQATTKINQLVNWIKEQMKNLDEWEGIYYSLEMLLEKQNFSDFLVVTNNKDEIVDLIYTSPILGIDTLYPYFLDKKETLFQIQKYLPNSIIQVNYWEGENLINTGAIQLSMRSSFCNQAYEVLDGVFYSYNKDNEFILRDKIEHKYFFDIDENINIEVIQGEDSNRYFLQEDYTYPMWRTENNHSVIIGFHYLQPDCFENNTLLILKSKDVVIGVIKYGLYDEGPFKHYGLNFIDVNLYHRNKGFATKLIQELANVIPKDYPLVLTDESDMGKMCQMEKHFKDIFSSDIYTRKEWEEKQYDDYYR